MKTIALLLPLCGCFVLPKTTTTTRDLGTETGDVEHGAVSKINVQAEQRGAIVEIAATAQRSCSRRVYRVTETTKEKHARFRPNRDARAAPLALLLAPITIPLSALGTGIAVLADGDGTTTQQHETVGTKQFPCTTVAADVAVAVRMPSGVILTESTDRLGLARVRIPDSEPYTGELAIAGPDGTATLRYARAMPAITAVRETATTCGARHGVTGTVKVELHVDGGGRAVQIDTDPGDDELARCIADGVAGVRFGDAHRNTKLVLPLELPG